MRIDINQMHDTKAAAEAAVEAILYHYPTIAYSTSVNIRPVGNSWLVYGFRFNSAD